MKTTKPLATISYNSVGFLIGVLDRLIDTEIISFYAFIVHQPEEDENKAHAHVYIEPAKAVDTLWLRKQFNEPDADNPTTPKGCLPVGHSKWVDWYWYGLHDKAYLASKNQSRKYHYQPSDMITSDIDYLMEKVRENPNPKAEIIRVVELIEKGFTPLQIATQLNVPLRNLAHFAMGLQLLNQRMVDFTDRNGAANHEMLLEPPEEKGGEEDD